MLPLQTRISNFIKAAKEVNQGQNYDYSLVSQHYTNNRTKVPIIDKDIDDNGKEYGIFWITPSNLLKGKGHPQKKGKRISDTKRFTQEEWVMKAREVHKGENIDYSKVVYTGAHDNVYIIDNDINPTTGKPYGGYWQEANSHLRGHGHPLKGVRKGADVLRMTNEEFIRRGKLAHPNRDFDYSLVEYKNQRTPVKIICPKHGIFNARAGNFIRGKGCPICSYSISKAEDELYEILSEKLGVGLIKKRNRSVLCGQREIDLYIPSKKIGIEYNGLRWHSDQFGKDKEYHINKLNDCNKNGVSLIQIFEDEYFYHKDVVVEKLCHILNVENNILNINENDLYVVAVDSAKAEAFYKEFSLDVFVGADVNLACCLGDSVVSMMSFKNDGLEKWEVSYFATDYHYRPENSAFFMLDYFVRKYNPHIMLSYIDRRWGADGKNVYEEFGFRFNKNTEQTCFYTNGHGSRYSENDMVELRAILKDDEYYRIWDCGAMEFIWEDKNSAT